VNSSPWLAVYLRKSRDKSEAADPELLSKHRRELLRLAESKGDIIPPVRIFEEIGSGEKINRRPVFTALLEDLERLPRGHGGRLYTTEVSRLTRGDLAARGRIQGALQRAQIRHITRGREYDLTSADDRFVWEIEAGVSGYELGRFKQRVDAARIDMAHQGRLRNGCPPFGWDWDRNTKQPVPNVYFPVVQAICRDAPSLSTYALSRKYHINPVTVLELLRNPFIAGWPAKRHFPHNGDKEWIKPSYLAPPEQWIWPVQQAEYPAACTLEEWHLIQQALDRRRNLREKQGSDAGWCRDVIRFQGYDRQPKLGTRVGVGVRELTYALTPDGQPRLYIARSTVHEAASREILAILQDTQRLPAQLEAARPKPSAPIADATGTISALEADLDDLVLLEARYTRAGDQERLAPIHRKQQALEKELKTLRAQIVAARAPIAIDTGTAKVLLALGRQAPAWWEQTTDTEKRRIASGLLERVLVAIEPRPRGFGGSYLREVVEVVRAAPFRHEE
jgi:DNA invertase Pin-like site-specific DNA recombinase